MKKTEEQTIDLIKKLFEKRTISKIDSSIGIQFNPVTVVEINLLKALLNADYKDNHIIKAIATIKDISTLNLSSFKTSLKDITQSESRRDHLTKWKILIPCEVNFKKRHLKINGFTFNILSYLKIKKDYPLEFSRYYKGQKLETRKIENKKCKYLVVETNGYSLYRAWKTIEPTYNMLRGLLDYVISFNTWTFFSIPKARTIIPHPHTVFGISTESHVDFLDFQIQKSNNKIVEISLGAKQKFEKHLKVFKKRGIKNSMTELLSDIFRLYSQAMEEDELQYGFLKFWQIAERLSSPNPNGTSNDRIIKRITFFTDPTPVFDLQPYIDKLSKKRNDLVHRGIDEIEENDFNILKSICGVAIEWLFFNRSNLKTTNHLEFFYTSNSLSEIEIRASIDTLNYIKSQKNK